MRIGFPKAYSCLQRLLQIKTVLTSILMSQTVDLLSQILSCGNSSRNIEKSDLFVFVFFCYKNFEFMVAFSFLFVFSLFEVFKIEALSTRCARPRTILKQLSSVCFLGLT